MEVQKPLGPLADARDMFAVHTMFRREFGLMSSLVRSVQDRDMERAVQVANHVDVITDILHVHHSGEDAHVWPRVLERGDDEAIAIVESMEEPHNTIAPCLVHVKRANDFWRADGGPIARDALARSIDRLIPVLRNHLRDEERRAVPLIETYVTAAEYARIPQEAAKDVSPEMLPTLLGMVWYEASPEVVDAIVAEMPPDVRPNIRELARSAYAAYAQAIYGTTTPPKASEI